MDPRNLELLITHYLDGTLPPRERVLVERILATDPAAREMLRQHQALTRLLKTDVPEIDEEALAASIADAVAQSGGMGVLSVHSSVGASLPEDQEHLISQYLDNTLSDDQRQAVEGLIASDASARAAADQHSLLNAVLKEAAPLPAVNWDRLAAHLSDSIDALATSPAITDEFEYTLTRYLDGELAESEMAAVESRLAADPAARLVLHEHRALADSMRQSLPLPNVQWENLAAHISSAIDEAAQRRRYSITAWIQTPVRLAAAACVILLLSLSILFYVKRTPPTPPTSLAIVDVLQLEEKLTGEPVAEFSFGGPAMADADSRSEDGLSPAIVSTRGDLALVIDRAPASPDTWPVPF
jgi:anti-sigma factor RsiW